MNRTDRLVAMVMYMQGRRLIRAEDMAKHFEVSVRTVYRDLGALSEAGVPITGEAGVGYTLMKSYHLPPVMLTAEEASALFVGAEMAKQFTDGSMVPPIEAALLKLRAVLPRERQEYIDQLGRKTVVVGPGRLDAGAAAEREWLLPLQEAAVRRRAVELCYRARGKDEETRREVEPLGVVFYAGSWYLVAWCRLRGDIRHFRLDRIQRVTLRDEIFQPRPEFSLEDQLVSQGADEQLLPVRVWFSSRAIDRARRESFIRIVEEKRVSTGVEVEMGTFCMEWLATWLLSFGGEAEALEPEELREKVRAVAEKVLQRHAECGLAQAQPA